MARDEMTSREREVFNLACEGLTNKEIAAILSRESYIAEKTVKAHMGRILRKTGCSNRLELPAFNPNTKNTPHEEFPEGLIAASFTSDQIEAGLSHARGEPLKVIGSILKTDHPGVLNFIETLRDALNTRDRNIMYRTLAAYKNVMTQRNETLATSPEAPAPLV